MIKFSDSSTTILIYEMKLSTKKPENKKPENNEQRLNRKGLVET